MVIVNKTVWVSTGYSAIGLYHNQHPVTIKATQSAVISEFISKFDRHEYPSLLKSEFK